MEVEGSEKVCQQRWGGGGGGGTGGGGGGGLPYYIEVFLEIPHDAAQENNIDVNLSFVNKQVR